MSNRRTKKDKKEHSKKEQKRTKKTIMLDNEDKVLAVTTYMENTNLFEIDEIDIDKIGVSKKYLHEKEYDSYKHYVLYEHNNEYIPLKIILKDVIGYYNEYENTDNIENTNKANKASKRINFKLEGNFGDKFYDIFVDIKKKQILIPLIMC